MLCLSRKLHESICIGDNVTVTVMGIRGCRVSLGIEAPAGTHIVRAELVEQKPPDPEGSSDG